MVGQTNAAIEFHGITKQFGDLIANDSVSFSVTAGTIHGVVGENGAGKSTIMKVLYGMYTPEQGEISLFGKPVRIRTPHDAIALGIGMVHQHFMLVPPLPVWKNVVLGAEPGWHLDSRALIEELDTLQASFGLRLSLEKPVEELTVGQRQQVEILKLLYRKAEVLILDEPTAVLTPQEVDALFARLLELQKTGKTIVLITHKLHEILRFTQNVTVMRQGKVVTTTPTSALTEPGLAELIIGRKAKRLASVAAATDPTRAPALEMKAVTVSRSGEARPRLDQVSLTVRPGEIVGIAGISGNGQETLIEVITGIERHYQGTVTLLGRSRKEWNRYQVKQEGFAVIPADRNEEGLIGNFTVQDNLTLGHHREARYAQGVWRGGQRIAQATAPLLERYDVRPRSLTALAGRLSGGNQQKVIIARELDGETRFLIAAYPTRGVDIGAIELIYDLIQKRKQAGAGVLLISAELDELLQLSDRILVLYEGQVVAEIDPKQTDPKEIGLAMTGGTKR